MSCAKEHYDSLSVSTHVLPARSNVTSQGGWDNEWEYKACSASFSWPNCPDTQDTRETQEAVQKVRFKFESLKMPPKRGILFLFWLQSTFAEASFFGPNFFSSGFPPSSLVHLRNETVDIVSFSILHKIIDIKESRSCTTFPTYKYENNTHNNNIYIVQYRPHKSSSSWRTGWACLRTT